MVQDGIVIELMGNEALVQFGCDSKKCSHCKACSGFADDASKVVWLDNALNASIGDTVGIELPERSMLGATAILYILPLICLIVTMLLAKYFGASDIMAAVLSLLMTGIVYLVVRLLEPRFKASKRFAPKMASVKH